MAKNRSYDLVYKLLLLGDSGVGKTSILFRFSGNDFNISYISTIGVDFKIKTIELRGKIIKLQIWDTAGHERFKSITVSYYRGARGILLVYDITKLKTFDSIANWLKDIYENTSGKVSKVIIGNKCDMEDQRLIKREKGETFAKDFNIKFFETSAKANINIEKAFLELVEEILNEDKDSPETDKVLINKQVSGNDKRKCC